MLKLMPKKDDFWKTFGRGRRQWGGLPNYADSAENGEWPYSRPAPPAGVRRILWATPSAAGPRPLHSRIADSRHCCKRILAFFGTPTCHLRVFCFFWDTGSLTKDTLRSRPGFLLISGGFCCPWSVSYTHLRAHET